MGISPRRQRGARMCRPFSMIEIVLGLGLIAFGLISIVGLFPVGLRANKDSIGETYGAEHADQLLHFLSARVKDPANSFQAWTTIAGALPTGKPGDAEPTAWGAWVGDTSVSFAVGGTGKEFYRVQQHAVGEARQEFTAICRIWRDPVKVNRFVSGAWQTTTLPLSDAMTLHCEISWPDAIPYKQRRKALYSLEVFRPRG